MQQAFAQMCLIKLQGVEIHEGLGGELSTGQET